MKVLKNISLRKKLEKESSDLQKEVNKLIKTMNTNLQRERLRQKRPPPKAAGSNPAPKPAPEQPEREVFTSITLRLLIPYSQQTWPAKQRPARDGERVNLLSTNRNASGGTTFDTI